MRNDEDSAWRTAALLAQDEHGGDFELWRRAIAVEWLLKGDSRPVQELLFWGEPLGSELSRLLAAMMDPEWHDLPAETLPVRLEVTRRTGKSGRPEDMERSVLKRLVADRIRDMIDSGTPYDGAVATVVEAYPEARLTIETARKMYSAHHGRKARARKGKKPSD